jgi:peptidoglycan-N-acetylglucosamine deacetylase
MSLSSEINPGWQPSPTIWASVALHGAAAVAAIAQPPLWPWALGAIAANHAGLTAVGLWPRSRLLGPNITRLPDALAAANKIALTFDDGPNPAITPWVLDELDKHEAKATFFCVGQHVRAHPELTREIVKRGHVIENHSNLHSHAFSTFGMKRLRLDIEAAQATITEHTHRVPALFRAPAGLRSPLLEPVLARCGLQLASWTRRGFDTVEQNADKVFQRLEKNLGAGDILLLHDGASAAHVNNRPIIFDVLPRLLTRFDALGLRVIPIISSIVP